MANEFVEREKLEIDRRRLAVEDQKVSVDMRRADIEARRLAYEPKRVSSESTIKFADLTVRSLLLLNGGAALAVLTFAANSAKGSSGAVVSAQDLAPSILLFGSGAATSVATAAASYVAQLSYTQDYKKVGNTFQVLAVIGGVASLVLFVAGMIVAARRFASVVGT